MRGNPAKPLQINALWIGDHVPKLQIICLMSAIRAGNPVRLFRYRHFPDLPREIVQEDAREIFPETAIIRHHRTGSPSLFADRFRYEIMRRGLGAWADTDILFLKPLLPESDMICGWESETLVGNSLLYFTPESEVLARLCEFAAEDYPVPPWYPAPRRLWLRWRKARGKPVHVSGMTWGVMGPWLVTHTLRTLGRLGEAWPVHRIFAVPYFEKFGPFRCDYDRSRRVKADTVCIHLWAQGLHGGTTARRARALPLAEPGSLVADMADAVGIPV